MTDPPTRSAPGSSSSSPTRSGLLSAAAPASRSLPASGSAPAPGSATASGSAGPSRLVGYLPGAVFLALVALRVRNGFLDEALFNADALYPASLLLDLHAGGLQGWKLPPVPCFFPDTLLEAATLAVTRDLRAAAGVYALAQAALFLVALRLVIGASLRRRGGAPGFAADALAGGVGMVVLAAGAGGLPFARLLVSPAQHAGTAIVSLVALAGALRWVERPRRGLLVTLALASFLAVLSDGLFLLWVVAPGLVVGAVAGWRVPALRPRLSVLALAMAAPAALAWWSAPLLLVKSSGADYLGPWTPDAVAASAVALASTLPWFATPGGAAFAAVALAGLATALRRALIERDALAGYVVAVVVLVPAGIIALGMARDIHCLRYLLLPLYLAPAHAAIAAGGYLRGLHRPQLAIVGVTGLAAVALASSSLPPRRRPGLAHYRPPFERCVAAAVDRHGLGLGLADFWHAEPLRLLSRRGLRLQTVDTAGRPRHWMGRIDRYRGGAGGADATGEDADSSAPATPVFDYVLTDRLDPGALRATLGEADLVESCPGGAEVWIYRDGRLERRFGPLLEQAIEEARASE